MNKNATIKVSVVKYQPDVQIDIPMALMVWGPATITLTAAKQLRDALDVAIKEFESRETSS